MSAERYTCGLCNGELPEIIKHGGLHLETDWFGDGKTHPAEDYPAPQPLTSHGLRVSRDGEVLHECGSWVSA